MKRLGGRARSARWVLPLTLVIVTVVSLVCGRELVAGLITVLAVGFVLGLVGAFVWALLAMAGPGPRGALRDLPGSFRELMATPSRVRRWVFQHVGQAPWRSPEQVVRFVSVHVTGAVAELPSGPAAYRHIRVRLHPQTLHRLDLWMAIQEVAATWAEHYVATHRALWAEDESVTVSVCSGEDVPRGRGLVEGAFRADADGSDTWATARRSLSGSDRGRRVAGTGGVGAVRFEGSVAEAPATAHGQATDGLTGRPYGDATMRFPAAGVRVPGPDAGLLPGATVKIPVHTQTRRVLGLARVDPDTGPPGDPPVFFDTPRMCLGRDPGMDLMVDDPYVSREHAEARRVDDQWTIADGSTHGTSLNGTPLTPGKPYPLRDGDIITLSRDPQPATPSLRVVLGSTAPGGPGR